MIDVKKLIAINFIDDTKIIKFEKLKFINKCEICITNKMHRFSNYNAMKILFYKRINKKIQRIHINLIDENYIIRTF